MTGKSTQACVLLVSVLFTVSCGRHIFRVVPSTPNYVLIDPGSRRIPFPEILRDYNGSERGRGWMDLLPDMELRIENAYYEPGASRRGLSGFLGTEIARYKVGSHGGLELLSVQSMQNRPGNDLPVQQLIPIEQQRARRFRFYSEVFFRKTGNTRGSVLLSAGSKEQLDRLAAELMRDPDSVCAAGTEHCTAFPEACSVSIEMEVVVNGKEKSLVWGSTVASVVKQPRELQLRRLYKGHLIPMKIDANDPNALRLPLLPGDHLNWK